MSLQTELSTLTAYMPEGWAWSGKNVAGSVSNSLSLGFAAECLRVATSIAEFRTETIPDLTTHYISEWESALGIPGDCFDAMGDDDTRRRDILAKLAALGVQSAAEWVALALDPFGVTVTVQSGIDTAVVFSGGNDEARNTVVVDFFGQDSESFTYTFENIDIPAGWPTTGLRFVGAQVFVIECLFTKLKQANNNILFRFF